VTGVVIRAVIGDDRHDSRRLQVLDAANARRFGLALPVQA
jgi:hypothetical protein